MTEAGDPKTPADESAEDETAVDPSEAPDQADPAADPAADSAADSAVDEPAAKGPVERAERRASVDWQRVLAYGVLPAVALILAMAAGYFKYVDNSVREGDTARAQSVQAATASTIAILSYTPDKVDQQLHAARDVLTGTFLNSYTSLIEEVVIPGAKQQQISAVATVPKAGSISAAPGHAVVLVFVNQTVVIGTGAPSNTASSVRVTLDEVGGKWLISDFTPV